MSGIYIHIPFCKKACHYCDFHFSTSLKNREYFVDALIVEIEKSKDSIIDKNINTIYFGGGTPSLLSTNELSLILNTIKHNFHVNLFAEITLEANPDDLTTTKTSELKQLGINRLSIGIQTYHETILTKLNRSHNYQQAIDSVKNAHASGFNNINIDIIFGLPEMNFEDFKIDIQILIGQNPKHVSAYWLTIEEKTAFGKWQKQGVFTPLPDEHALMQWSYLKEELKKAGYIQYEISNFSKPNYESIHNGNYWKGVHYIGLGPSAHSFNGNERSWNIANNKKYIDAIQKGTSYQTTEKLTSEDKINEHIMTRIRTMWGIDLNYLKTELCYDLLKQQSIIIEKKITQKKITISQNTITLTDKGQQFADEIASDLFV